MAETSHRGSVHYTQRGTEAPQYAHVFEDEIAWRETSGGSTNAALCKTFISRYLRPVLLFPKAAVGTNKKCKPVAAMTSSSSNHGHPKTYRSISHRICAARKK